VGAGNFLATVRLEHPAVDRLDQSQRSFQTPELMERFLDGIERQIDRDWSKGGIDLASLDSMSIIDAPNLALALRFQLLEDAAQNSLGQKTDETTAARRRPDCPANGFRSKADTQDFRQQDGDDRADVGPSDT